MQVSYRNMWKLLIDLDISPVALRKAIGVSASTMTRMRQNQLVSLDVLGKICAYLGCELGDIVEFKFDDTMVTRAPLAVAQ